MKKSALVWLLTSVVACSGSSPTGIKPNYLTTLNGTWAASQIVGSCSDVMQVTVVTDAAGNLSGTAYLKDCAWASGDVAITGLVNPSTGAVTINAAAPLTAGFFVGGVQAKYNASGTTDTGLTGTVTGDGNQWVVVMTKQ